jgi:hypothetical protein
VYGKLQRSIDENCDIPIEPSATLKLFIDGSITINWMWLLGHARDRVSGQYTFR